MAVIKGGFEIVKRAMLKELMKRGDDGIMLTLPKNEIVDLNARITMDRLIKAGIDPESLTSPDQVLNVLENINNQIINNARVIPGTSAEGKAITEKLFGKKGEVVDMTGKKIDTSQGIMGGKSVKELMESGQVQKGTDDIKISDKITEREMFKNSNLNKRDSVTETISYIKTLEPIDAMKEANSVIGRKGKYKNLTPEESKKILQDTEDHIFERDIPDEDFAKGGRAGYAAGNQVTPAIDQRMNLDYNTLVDQNTAQRGFMDNWRNHAITSQKMKGKAGLESIPNYGMQSGYDFKKNFQDMNPKVAAGLSLGYQGLTEGLGMFNPNNPNFLNPIKTGKTIYNDYQKNVEGILNAEANNLTPKEQADRNKYLEVKDPVVDQDRISEIVEQQKAAGVPDEGLITNFNKPTMADVAGPSLTQYSNIPELTRLIDDNPNINSLAEANDYLKMQAGVVPGFTKLKNPDGAPGNYNEFMYKGPDGQIYGSQTYSSIAAGQYPDIYNPNSQTLSSGGRAGYYTGGMVDVEPNLSDIGHGSDALMARTRLVAPDSQATTSTGLNYLLAEDNDNIRVPFAGGGDPKRRAFLKLLATLGGGIAGVKSGIIGLGGKEAGKKAVTETVKQATGSGTPPPYFFKLAEKIKMMGDDIGATQDRTIAKSMKSKDGKSEYILEEDVSTGDTLIKKINKESDDMVTDVEIMQHSKGQADELTKGKKPADSYEEVTEYNSRIYKDNFNEPDYEDGINLKEILEEVGEPPIKKADGGRIGFSGGGIFRAIIAKAAAAKGMKPYEFIKVTSYKSLPPEVKMFLSADDFAKLKSGQQDLYTNYIDMAKTRKNFQEQVEGGKTTPARELFEGMEKSMDQQSYVPKTVTSDDIAQMELMVKNRFNKGRKDNAQGGLQTMLGE